MHERQKKRKKASLKQNTPMYQNDTSGNQLKNTDLVGAAQNGDTRELIAKRTGVSPATIGRDARFARAVEKVKEIDPKIEAKIASGNSPPKETIVHAAKMIETNPDEAKAMISGNQKRRATRQGTRARYLTSARLDVLKMKVRHILKLLNVSANSLAPISVIRMEVQAIADELEKIDTNR